MRTLQAAPPLVVDLDGTLIRTDSLVESMGMVAKAQPSALVRVPAWWMQGRAALKARLFECAMPDVRTLPFDPVLLRFLRAQHRQGRRLVLATGSDQRFAQAVAQELQLFDAVLASDGVHNLSGPAKRDRLVAEFGKRGFDYVGHSVADLPVWAAARQAILVAPSAAVTAAAARLTQVGAVIASPRCRAGDLARELRMHHWPKSLLVFVPLLATQNPITVAAAVAASWIALAFCLAASSVYLLNDLLDLPQDRLHPHKRRRPLASGRVPITLVLGLMPLLWVAAMAIAVGVDRTAPALIGAYSALMLAYCLRLKDIVLVDAVALAVGYTLRIVAGAQISGLPLSPWLLASSVLLFFSLALLKRCAELWTLRRLGRHRAGVYRGDHIQTLVALGAASGIAALIAIATLPWIEVSGSWHDGPFWPVCAALLLAWMAHLWQVAWRGRMRADPATFAVRDPASLALAALLALAWAALR